MFQIFARSYHKLNLSPGERAALKLVGGIGFTGVGAGVLVALQLFLTGNHDFAYISAAAGGAAAKTLWDTIGKYKSAQTDLPLAEPSLASVPKDTPAPLAPPVPMPGSMFTTPVPLPPAFGTDDKLYMDPVSSSMPPSAFIPMPQAGGAYVPPPAFDRDWSGLVPSMPTERIATP